MDIIRRDARVSFVTNEVDFEDIAKKMNSNVQDYEDDLYDSQDRRILRVTSNTFSIQDTTEWQDNEVFCYMFTSILDLNNVEVASMDLNMMSLSTGDITYEKMFSSDLKILTEEEIVYIDINETKYTQTPLLAKNRRFYKTQTVSRDTVISKVQDLVNRFKNGRSGPLSDVISSLEYVIETQSETEYLLSELAKVRKSFPNKTNNNPIGNLYALLSKLLLNINSAFLPSEKVKREKYVVSKIIDKREGLDVSFSGESDGAGNSGDYYIPDGLFFIDRERLSYDGTDDDISLEYSQDASRNYGAFLVRYEEMLRNESKISKIFDIDKDYAMPREDDFANFRRMLFKNLLLVLYAARNTTSNNMDQFRFSCSRRELYYWFK